MDYKQAKSFVNSFIDYERKETYAYKKSFKLERIKNFLSLLGNPQNKFKSIHVAGTKGKGSVCAFLAYILKEAGYKAGLYTSPHLSDIRERIRLLQHRGPECGTKVFEGMISKKEFRRLVEEIKPQIEEFNRGSRLSEERLTFFEVLTAMAFVYFAREKVDYAVLETGLGGRLDATNIVHPSACGITPIGLDHTQQLGNTLSKIAKEKAGIIKGRRWKVEGGRPAQGERILKVISANQPKQAEKIIRARCKEKGARLFFVGKDILVKNKTVKSNYQVFDITGIKEKYRGLKISLRGRYQSENSALAVGLCEALNDNKIKQRHIRRGLKNTVWPGRLEIIGRKPLIVLDGAQNQLSARALKEAIRNGFRYEKLILILGISSDKDVRGICAEVCPEADKIILTRAVSPRACLPEKIKQFIDGPAEIAHNVQQALNIARTFAAKKDLILITGSLFLAGEARSLL